MEWFWAKFTIKLCIYNPIVTILFQIIHTPKRVVNARKICTCCFNCCTWFWRNQLPRHIIDHTTPPLHINITLSLRLWVISFISELKMSATLHSPLSSFVVSSSFHQVMYTHSHTFMRVLHTYIHVQFFWVFIHWIVNYLLFEPGEEIFRIGSSIRETESHFQASEILLFDSSFHWLLFVSRHR